MAIAFNVPYLILAMTYAYPAVLRRPAGEALAMFAAGGSGLVLTWHAFALTALLLVPLSMALALTPQAVARTPALAIGAAISGALAGLAQAIGLWRWVFVVPGLARIHTDPATSPEARRAAEEAFNILNQYGGVAIGEHLGQVMTALFVLMLSLLQWRDARHVIGAIGFATALCILIGTQEGVAIALGRDGDAFTMATIVGFLGLTVWLIGTGVGLLRCHRAISPLRRA
jgi:hypothetical protein